MFNIVDRLADFVLGKDAPLGTLPVTLLVSHHADGCWLVLNVHDLDLLSCDDIVAKVTDTSWDEVEPQITYEVVHSSDIRRGDLYTPIVKVNRAFQLASKLHLATTHRQGTSSFDLRYSISSYCASYSFRKLSGRQLRSRGVSM